LRYVALSIASGHRQLIASGFSRDERWTRHIPS
jgi:hypothetical protein